jgi:hypothetical protein
MGRRKYCSAYCRQRLRYHLDIRTGLLRALNTRYAAFYFSESMIVMDVLPYDSCGIYTYIYPRSPASKPADDFSRMANHLGAEWWEIQRLTRKRYLATRHLLERAAENHSGVEQVKPMERSSPSHIGRSIVYLEISRRDLDSPELRQIIKNAYRRQAKRHHPDQGGDAALFRRIHQAYEEIVRWAENPSFVRRRGLPDKWFYDGGTNRWVGPTSF